MYQVIIQIPKRVQHDGISTTICLTSFPLCFCLWLVFLPTNLIAQNSPKFFNGNGGYITDFSGVVMADTFATEVAGLPNTIDKNFGLAKIKLDIFHQKSSDLKVELMSPSGVSIWLVNRAGHGAGFTNTGFRSNGFSGYVRDADNPFNGEYIPDGRMDYLNNGQNPNGTWKLIISDLKASDTGGLNYFRLEFSDNPMPNLELGPCSFENPAACLCADGKIYDSCILLPDLVLLPRFTDRQLHEHAQDDPGYPGHLRLAATIANIGSGPMEVYGKGEWYCGNMPSFKDSTCPDSSRPRQLLYQKVYYLKDGKLLKTDRISGTNYFENMPGHNHYHVDSWVEFRLVKYRNKEKKKSRKVIARGQKVSYCLFDNGICNNTDSICQIGPDVWGDKNLPNYGLGNFPGCESASQGISVGGYDYYGLTFEGQFIKIPPGTKNGEYWLEIELDPEHKYIESNRNNNLLEKKVVLTKQVNKSK